MAFEANRVRQERLVRGRVDLRQRQGVCLRFLCDSSLLKCRPRGEKWSVWETGRTHSEGKRYLFVSLAIPSGGLADHATELSQGKV